MRRCPVCYGWVSKKAAKCKHCNATLKRNNADEQIISYINNGFDVIENECHEFEAEISKMSNGYFKLHEYSDEELIHSPHIEKIKSIAGKMGSDIENWDVRGALSDNVRNYYDNKISVLKQQMVYLMGKIKSRRRTGWDCAKDLLLSSYNFIFNIAFYHFKNFAVHSNGFGLFNLFGRSSHDFEDFVYGEKKMETNIKEDDIKYDNKKHA
jgi:hypothetical protein